MDIEQEGDITYGQHITALLVTYHILILLAFNYPETTIIYFTLPYFTLPLPTITQMG